MKYYDKYLYSELDLNSPDILIVDFMWDNSKDLDYLKDLGYSDDIDVITSSNGEKTVKLRKMHNDYKIPAALIDEICDHLEVATPTDEDFK